MIKTVIFDVDNTLYDYNAAHEVAFRAVTEYAGQALGLSAEEFAALHSQADAALRKRAGTPCAAIHNRLLRYQLLLERIGASIVHAPRMNEAYWSAFLAAMEPVAGVAECLAWLKAAGYTIGAGTNMTADYQYAKLERLELLGLLDFLVTSEEVGTEKPDRRLFDCCVKKAGCAPEECLFVGDNLEMDVMGARQAGLNGVWLSPRGKDIAGVRRIPSLEQLPPLLQASQIAPGETGRPMDILFLDLDGTLLNDQKEITPENRAAIQRARAAGCQVVITSGRPLRSALEQARRLELAGAGCYVIAYNGAVIYDCAREAELFRQTLELDALFALFDEANRRGLHIQTYDDSSVLVEPRCDNQEARRYCRLAGMDFSVIEQVRQITQPPVKALCIDFQRQEGLEDFRQWANAHLAGRISCVFSSRFYLEAMPAGVSKGRAVEALCRRLDIPLQNAVAVGDEVNDISMIQAAGTGVAMDNAVPEVKAAADYVTQRDNNHDAIAEVVRIFLSLGTEQLL